MYIIVGKEVKKGDFTNDSSSINEYFELGWEVGCTHVDLKYLLSIGKVTPDDIIVTHSDREFLYEGLFKKVITWADFQNLNQSGIQVLDMVENTLNHHFGNSLPQQFGVTNTHYHDVRLIWNGDKIPDNIIFSFNPSDLSKFDTNKSFAFNIEKEIIVHEETLMIIISSVL